LEIKKSGKISLFLAFSQSKKLSSGKSFDKTLSELHIHKQISSDESLRPCRVQRMLQRFYCCPKNHRC